MPTFPGAEYLFARTEYEYWSDHRDEAFSFAESVVPIVERGLHRLVDADHRVTGEVWLERLPRVRPEEEPARWRTLPQVVVLDRSS